MGTGIGCEHKNLMNIELKQGQELAHQLKEQLCSPKRSKETCEILVATILSSFEKSLSILKSSALKLQDDSMLNSLHSSPGDASPRSEMPDEPRKNVFKKRKAMTQWSEQVQVPFGPGIEGPVGDEYSWRKYGQKNILGATFPRAYYRCTYRNSQGCLATKQVQRSDESLSLQVIYKGRHTCKKGSESSAGSASCGNQEKRHKIQKQNVEITINFGTCDKTEELGRCIQVERMPSFSFPSTNHFCPEDTREYSFIDSRYLPSLVNQETSECSYPSLSPYHNMNNFEIGQNLGSSC
ncbi:hypothetical protein ACET3Z_007045 [Daucus carota]